MLLEKEIYFERLKNFSEDQFLSGNNFAKKADLVYAEAVSYDDFNKLKKDNINYSKIEENIYIYSKKNFSLKENDIVFCKTDNILELFSKLNSIKKLKNLKLITHQGAIPSIDEKLYSLKPDCISEWYSVNIKVNKANLHALPLGLGNKFSDVSLNSKDFKKFYNSYENKIQENKIYSNFRINTNPIREQYLKHLKENKNFVHEESKLNKYAYLEKISNYKYVFSPRGLGIDTHRFWEILYAGSIPVAKNELTYKSFTKYYQEFTNITSINMDVFKIINFNDSLIDILNIDYWIEKINKNRLDSSLTETIDEKDNFFLKEEIKLKKKYVRYKIIKSDLSFRKKINFYIRSIRNFEENLFKRFWHVDY